MKRSLYALITVMAVLIVAYMMFGKNGGEIRGLTENSVPAKQLGTALPGQDIMKIASSAVATRRIDISSCDPKPNPAGFALGSKVLFENKSDAAKSISFSPAHAFSIAPASSLSVTFDFWKIPGIRRYTCDGKEGGIIVLQ